MIAILGAGVMGTGLATLVVGHGVPVTLVDTDVATLAAAKDAVGLQLRGGRLMGRMPRSVPAGELTGTTSLTDAANASAVIEAVTERPDVKAKVLADVSSMVAPGTLILTNTSAIPVDELASAVDRPEDVAGAHFMNPPYLIRMVEVIRGPRTSEAAMKSVRSLLAMLNCDHVTVGDGPGFVVNRILQRSINEAARIVEEGIASAPDVDALFQGCLGHRTGPLATADLIGLDNVADSLHVLHERTGDAGYAPCELLLSMVRSGQLGRKTGQGFYEHGGAPS